MFLSKENAIKLNNRIKSSLFILFGTFLLAVGTGIFLLPFDLVSGGVSGISIILSRIFFDVPFFSEISVDVYASVLNIFMFLLGFIFLGRMFSAKTLLSAIIYPPALTLALRIGESDIFGGFFNLLSDKYLPYENITIVLAAVFGGTLVGAGCALTFLGGGSTGGSDIIALILCKYFKKLKSSYMIFICDATIILIGAFIINDIVVSLLGIVSAFFCAISIDKLFIGSSSAFVAEIISDKYSEINEAVIERMNRTTTITDCKGGYSGTEKKMVMVTFTMRQYAEFTAIVSSIDKNAFITVQRAHEIGGEGWSYEKKENERGKND